MESAMRPARWLAGMQQPDGSVGISAAQNDPRWPTSLALLAWCTMGQAVGRSLLTRHAARAAAWSLNDRGKAAPRSPQIGHDTELIGWSWAANTHSWLEPTCFFVLGLRAAGFGEHPRVREGMRLIVDRLLPTGGANYGNTIVLGQPLLPHPQPTGLAMLALGGERVDDSRLGRSMDYLESLLQPGIAPASLAFSCLGLAAHGRRPAEAHEWIDRALSDSTEPLAVYEQSLLLLAGLDNGDWLTNVDAIAAETAG